ncbi:MAG: hypothetical protein ABR512_07915 [Desulfopila sp.]
MKAEIGRADMMQEPAPAPAKAVVEKSTAQKAGDGPYCAVKVEKTLDLPANALLSKVEVSITAMPAGVCLLSEAGEIRVSQDDAKKAIIDLKRMRSVSGLKAPQTIDKINTWTGAAFGGSDIKVTKNMPFSPKWPRNACW